MSKKLRKIDAEEAARLLADRSAARTVVDAAMRWLDAARGQVTRQ